MACDENNVVKLTYKQLKDMADRSNGEEALGGMCELLVLM